MAEQAATTKLAKVEDTPLGRLNNYLLKQKIPVERIIPGGMFKFDEIIGAVMLAARKNTGIAQCDLESVLVSVMDCVSLGLAPHWGARGEAALVPFAGKCTLIVGYRGYAKLFHKSNAVKTLDAGARYSSDFWRFERRDSGIYWRHREADASRGELVSTFTALYGRDGGFRLVQVRRDKIEKIKAQVLAKVRDPKKLPDHPWNVWFEEMAIKTSVREAAKLQPTYELERAVEVDDAHSKTRGEDFIDSPGWREDQSTIAAALPPPQPREVIEPPRERVQEVRGEVVEEKQAPAEPEPDLEREAIQAEAKEAEAGQKAPPPTPPRPSERNAPDRGTKAFGEWILDGIAKAKDQKELGSFSRFDPGVDYPADMKDVVGRAYMAKRKELKS